MLRSHPPISKSTAKRIRLLLLGLATVVVAALSLQGHAADVSAQSPELKFDARLAPDSPIIPAGLRDGDGNGMVGKTFRLIFLASSDGSYAALGRGRHEGEYDELVQRGAKRNPELQRYADDFTALISIGNQNAMDRVELNPTNTAHADVPIYWLNGEKIADDRSDFWDDSWDSYKGTNELGDLQQRPCTEADTAEEASATCGAEDTTPSPGTMTPHWRAWTGTAYRDYTPIGGGGATKDNNNHGCWFDPVTVSAGAKFHFTRSCRAYRINTTDVTVTSYPLYYAVGNPRVWAWEIGQQSTDHLKIHERTVGTSAAFIRDLRMSFLAISKTFLISNQADDLTPQNVKVEQGPTSTEVKVSWDAIVGEKSYKIILTEVCGPRSAVTHTSTDLTATGTLTKELTLKAGTHYWVGVSPGSADRFVSPAIEYTAPGRAYGDGWICVTGTAPASDGVTVTLRRSNNSYGATLSAYLVIKEFLDPEPPAVREAGRPYRVRRVTFPFPADDKTTTYTYTGPSYSHLGGDVYTYVVSGRNTNYNYRSPTQRDFNMGFTINSSNRIPPPAPPLPRAINITPTTLSIPAGGTATVTVSLNGDPETILEIPDPSELNSETLVFTALGVSLFSADPNVAQVLYAEHPWAAYRTPAQGTSMTFGPGGKPEGNDPPVRQWGPKTITVTATGKAGDTTTIAGVAYGLIRGYSFAIPSITVTLE